MHPRRRLDIAFPTIKASLGEKFAPAFADRYLARHGYESQQTDVPTRTPRRDNLWRAVPGRHGARGRFDASARDFSIWLWLDLHRGAALATTAVLLLGLGAWVGSALKSEAEGLGLRPAAA